MRKRPVQSDLFGGLVRHCAHCGEPFTLTIYGRGRPVAFCGAGCRRDHARMQRRVWSMRLRRARAAKFADAAEGLVF